MKKILFVLISFPVLLTGCKKEKLEGKYDFLIGKWKCSNFVTHQSPGCGVPGNTCITECGEYDNTIEFLKDGSFEITHHPKEKTYKGRIKEIEEEGSQIFTLHLKFAHIGKNFFEKEIRLSYYYNMGNSIPTPNAIVIYSIILDDEITRGIVYGQIN